MDDNALLSREDEIKQAAQWYREHFPDWAESDCMNMAIRDCEAE
jgi:hypothetical protein